MTAVEAPRPARVQPERTRRPGRHLRTVERPTRSVAPAVPVLVGTGIVLLALFGLAVMHALLIGGQIRLDSMRREAAAEVEEIRRLQLEVAQLEAPERVLATARERLGMVAPAEVGYLLPAGVTGGNAEPVRVAAAVPPPPPPPPPTTAPAAPPADPADEVDGATDEDAPSTEAGPGEAPAAERDPAIPADAPSEGDAE